MVNAIRFYDLDFKQSQTSDSRYSSWRTLWPLEMWTLKFLQSLHGFSEETVIFLDRVINIHATKSVFVVRHEFCIPRKSLTLICWGRPSPCKKDLNKFQTWPTEIMTICRNNKTIRQHDIQMLIIHSIFYSFACLTLLLTQNCVCLQCDSLSDRKTETAGLSVSVILLVTEASKGATYLKQRFLTMFNR